MMANLTKTWRLSGFVMIIALIIGVALAYGTAIELVNTKGKALITAQEKDAVTDELNLLSIIAQSEGQHGLVLEISQQTQLHGANNVYALRDANGALVAGNLKAWPQGIDDNANWVSGDMAGRGALHISTRRVADGLTVLVGHNHQALDAFQNAIIGSVWIATAIVAVSCILLSIVVASFIMVRVRELSATAARVSAGDFRARVKNTLGNGPFEQIARAQNTMLERIEDLVTGLRTVTDSLAHDLRTPLSQSRRLIEAGIMSDNPEEKQMALEAVLIATDTTIATFTSLIDIARAEGGLSREAMEPVALAPLANDIYELFEPTAEERGIQFCPNFADIQIHGHRALLMQAMSNLVHNALKYAPENGRVDFAISRFGDGAQILVSDNGPGIAVDEREDAVKRFRQVGAEGRPQGLGLGLAIVDTAARLHRGKLILEDNAPGLKARVILAKNIG